jgi:hypothetical protein
MLNLKERTIGAIQRDRLSDFLRVANIYDSGCFYFALFMSWNYLFPDRVIDRTLAKQIVGDRSSLGISPRQVVEEVALREKQLKIRIAQIGVTNNIDQTPTEFSEYAGIPNTITVIHENYPVVFTKPSSSAVVLWMGNRDNANCRLHYTSTHPNNRFSPEEITEYHPEYAPVVIYHLERAIDK